MAKVNCILIFFQFFLFTDRVNPLGRGECLNGDRLLRRKEGKKERTIRSSLGKMLQIAYAYIHSIYQHRHTYTLCITYPPL